MPTLNEFLEKALKDIPINEVQVNKTTARAMVRKHQKILEKLADDLNVPFESIYNKISELVFQYNNK